MQSPCACIIIVLDKRIGRDDTRYFNQVLYRPLNSSRYFIRIRDQRVFRFAHFSFAGVNACETICILSITIRMHQNWSASADVISSVYADNGVPSYHLQTNSETNDQTNYENHYNYNWKTGAAWWVTKLCSAAWRFTAWCRLMHAIAADFE